ncbi:Ig-like domain repeat protein [Spirillospora sp. NPDC052269]
MSVGQVDGPLRQGSGWARWGRSRACRRGVVAVLMVVVCAAGGLDAAQRPAAAAQRPVPVARGPVAAAWPTDLALGMGYNRFGQLGNGTTVTPATPTPVLLPAGVRVSQVSGGFSHSLALTSDGGALAWGRNTNGQLGDGTTNTSYTPIEVHLPSGVTLTQVSAGYYHNLAVTSDGRVLAWGSNTAGELGDDSTTQSTTPVEVHLPSGVHVTHVSAGAQYSLALTSDGRALGWGYNGEGQLGDGTTTFRLTPVWVHLPSGVHLTDIAAEAQSLAVTSDGRVLGWGVNGDGQLGDGTTTDRHTPVYAHLPAGVSATRVAGGVSHSLAVTSDGRVLAWGYNYWGMLGDGTQDDHHTPVEVHLPTGVRVTEVSAGWSFSLALTSDGRGLGWGYNGDGRLGDGTSGNNRFTPVFMVLPPSTVATQVTAGSDHSLVLAEPAGTSHTSLTAHPTHAALGQQVTLTAHVACIVGPPPTSPVGNPAVRAGSPSGTVRFKDGAGTVIGTANVNADGTATLTTTSLGEGAHHITAYYEGDTDCMPSTSNTVVVTITNEPVHAGLHLDKQFDGFVSPSGTKAKHRHHAMHGRDAQLMSAWREHDAIRYRFVVTNTGDVPISTITIHDSHAGTITCSSHVLEPGQSVTCHGVHKVTSEEKSRGYVDNTATATGSRDDGEIVTSNKAHLRVDVTYK